MKTKDKLLYLAKLNFRKFGYKKMSTRFLAEEADMTTGAIYGIFKSKEGLFSTIVEKPVNQIIEIVEKGAEIDLETTKENVFEKLEKHFTKLTEDILHVIFNNFEETILVFFYSKGSKYEDLSKYIMNAMFRRELSLYEKFVGPADAVMRILIENLTRSFVYSILTVLEGPLTDKNFEDYIYKLTKLHIESLKLLFGPLSKKENHLKNPGEKYFVKESDFNNRDKNETRDVLEIEEMNK